MKMNKAFWENKYQEQQTGWNVGQISTPLKEYIDQLVNKDLKILIPGAGFGHEALYLQSQGFSNITVIDLAATPLNYLIERGFPKENTREIDFFACHEKGFDLILEQTFFCALDPKLRKQYALKMHELLAPKGKLAGVLFSFPLTHEGPPFGGCHEEYIELFSEHFEIKTLDKSYNSIEPRQGRELFFIFEKK